MTLLQEAVEFSGHRVAIMGYEDSTRCDCELQHLAVWQAASSAVRRTQKIDGWLTQTNAINNFLAEVRVRDEFGFWQIRIALPSIGFRAHRYYSDR
jgi:hypothetical protein